MNVYYLLYGINWYHVSDLQLPGSAYSLIAGDPLLFLKQYLLSFWSFKQAWLPPLVVLLLEKDPHRRKLFRAVAVWIFLYFLLFSATTSGRQVLLALPFSFLALGACLRILGENGAGLPGFSGRRIRLAALASFGALLLALYGIRDLGILETRIRHRDAFQSIEAHLRKNGVTRAGEIFTSDFDLYFRSLPPYIPHFNGGAPRLGTYRYNQEFPEFPVDSVGEFLLACRARGLRYVVLTPDSQKLSAALYAWYSGKRTPAGVSLDAAFGEHRIFKVVQPALQSGDG
jgi:hypothetical protein